MIYQFFKKRIPTYFSETVEVSEKKELIRLGIIKISEGSLLIEEKNQFTIIPYGGGWNPAGINDLKNYRVFSFLLKENTFSNVEIEYQAIRKWSDISLKLYTGWVYLIILFFGMTIVGRIGNYSSLTLLGTLLLSFFGISFCMCFGIDYFLLSSSVVKTSIRRDIIQRIEKFAYLLRGADLKIAEDSFFRQEREYFVKESRKKGWIIFSFSLVQNFLFIVLLYYFQRISNHMGRINADMEMMWIVVIAAFLILFLLHLFSVIHLIFLKMGNLDRIMNWEKIPGSKKLFAAGWLAAFPIFSFLSTFFAGKFLFSKK